MRMQFNLNAIRFGLAASVLAGLAVAALGGDLDSPASPTNAASAMFTLQDIHDVLRTRTTNVSVRPGPFSEPAGQPTNTTMATLNAIMNLATRTAPVRKTGQTATAPLNPAPAGSDGDVRLGVMWPVPRFTTNSVGTTNDIVILDRLTGLMWTKQMNVSGTTMSWNDAVDFCNGLNAANYGGYNHGWRLPSVRELQSLLDYGRMSTALPVGHPFVLWGLTPEHWTSTTRGNPFHVSLNTGNLHTIAGTSLRQVWPVRGAANWPFDVDSETGNLDSPESPTNAASAMWTMQHIYDVLDTRATNMSKRTDLFVEPSGGADERDHADDRRDHGPGD